MNAIDLNSDLGEGFGAYHLGMDEEVLQYVTSANIACGWHGGDPVVMEQTVVAAAAQKVRIGAHPGYPDLMGFGRREMKLSSDEITAYVLYQLGALSAFVQSHGQSLQHVKPHGALYNQGCKDDSIAMAICHAAQRFDAKLIVLAPCGSAFEKAAQEIGQPFAGEFFADRAYQSDGTLVSRKQPGAVLTEPDVMCRRVLQMAAQGTVTCVNGVSIPMTCQSICVHGDNAHALAAVQAIRQALQRSGIALRPIGELVRS